MAATPSADRFRRDLIRLLDTFADVGGRADSAIGRAFFGYSTPVIFRIREGRSFNFANAAYLEDRLRDGIERARQDRQAFDLWFQALYQESFRPKRPTERLTAAAG